MYISKCKFQIQFKTELSIVTSWKLIHDCIAEVTLVFITVEVMYLLAKLFELVEVTSELIELTSIFNNVYLQIFAIILHTGCQNCGAIKYSRHIKLDRFFMYLQT